MGDPFLPLLLLKMSLWDSCVASLRFHFVIYKRIIPLVHIFNTDIVPLHLLASIEPFAIWPKGII